MSLLNVESYVFINVFYLVLFCIHVCVDDVIYKKKRHQFCLLTLSHNPQVVNDGSHSENVYKINFVWNYQLTCSFVNTCSLKFFN